MTLEPNLFGDPQPRPPSAFDALTVRFVCSSPACSGLALIDPREIDSPGPVRVAVIEWQSAPDWEMPELEGHDRAVWWLLPESDEIEVLP